MRARSRPMLFAALLCAACSSTSSPGDPDAGGAKLDEGCARAAALRGRVAGLRAEGRLDRARRTLERAEALCAANAPASWAELLTLDAELGARAEGLALAEKVERAADAPAAAKQAAAALRKAFAAPAPEGEALIQSGLADLAAGKRAEAQRALDRGRIAIEQAKGKPMSVVVKGALRGTVTEHAWSEDGALLAVAHDRFVTVVPMDPARETTTFAEHAKPVTALQWLGSGRLASASRDGAVLIWSAANAAVERRLEVESGDVRLGASADAKLLAVGGGAAKLRVFRVDDGAKTFEVIQPEVRLLGFVPGRDELWVDAMAEIVWWDLASGKKSHVTGVGDSPRELAPNGRDVVVIQNEHELVFERDYGRATGPVLARAPGCEAHISPESFTPDGKTLLVGRRDGEELALEMPGGKTLWQRKGATEASTASRDAKLVADPGPGGAITIRDPRSLTTIASLSGARDPRALAFSPDSRHLVAFEGPGGLSTWSFDPAGSAAPRAPERVLGDDRGAVVALQAGPKGVTIARERSLTALPFGEPKAIWSTPVNARSAVIAEGGARAATVEGDDGVRFWDMEARASKGTLAVKAYPGILPSADTVAVAAEKGYSFSLRSAPGGAPDRPIPALGHRATFTRDGRLAIAVTEDDGRVGVWDAATGALKCKLGEPLSKDEPWPERVLSSRDGALIVALSRFELRRYAGCSDAAPRVTPTRWDDVPAGDAAMTDDGRFVYFFANTHSVLHAWDFERGTHEQSAVSGFKSFSVSPTGDVLLWSSDEAVLWQGPDKPGRPIALTNLTAASWAQGRLLLGTDDGSAFVVTPRDGRIVARLISAGAASLAIADDGRFEVFGDAGAALGCELAGKTYPIEVCRDRLETSGLLASGLRGDEANLDP